MAKTKVHGEYLDPSVISAQTEVTAVGSDHMLIFDATDNALKKALLSDLIETVGSTPTFTSLTVDDITINGSTISDSGDLTIDTEADLTLTALSDIIHQTTSTNSTAGHHIFKSFNTEIMRIDGGNNLVGIGHNSPSSFSSGANNLVVNDAAGAGGITIVTPNDAKGSIFFADGTGATGQGRIRYNHDGDYMTFGTNGSEDKLVINSSGMLLVNTTSSWGGETTPHIESRGDVAGDYTGLVVSNTNDAASDSVSVNFGLARDGGLVFGNAGKITVGKEQDWTTTPSTVDGFMSFSTIQNESLTERMRIDSSGNVAIGSTSDALANMSGLFRALNSSGGDRTVAHFGAHNYGDTGKTFINIGTEYGDGTSRIGSFNDTGNSSVLVFDTHSATSGQFTERMRIDSAGRVGLGSQITSNQASTYDSRANDFVVSGGGDTGITIAGGSTEDIRIVFTANGTTGLSKGSFTYDNANDTLAVETGGSQRIRIDSDGLKFGSDSAAANALDDYEEGVFDPTFTPASGSITPYTSYNTFAYTKVGRVVTITGTMATSSVSSPSGALTFGNLPFAMASDTPNRASLTRPSIHIYATGSGAPTQNKYYSAFIAFAHQGTSGDVFATYNSTHDDSIADWFAAGSDMFVNFSYITNS